MSTPPEPVVVEAGVAIPPDFGPVARWGPWRTGLAILRRDLFVTGREFPIFLAQVILQPLFLLFVFGKVLTELGYAQAGYQDVLFPGLVALAAVLTGLQSTALPLVIEFSYSNEIEDRLLAPLPVGAVAVEKVVFAAMRGFIAGVVMFPIGVWILGSIPWRASTGVAVVVMMVRLFLPMQRRVSSRCCVVRSKRSECGARPHCHRLHQSREEQKDHQQASSHY